MNSWSKYAFYKSFRIHEMVTEWKNKHSKLKFNGPLEKKLTSVLTEGWVFDGLYHLRDIFKFVRKKTDISINIFILDALYVQSKDEN